MGVVYSDKKEWDKAIECYEKALELDPDYISAWLFMKQAKEEYKRKKRVIYIDKSCGNCLCLNSEDGYCPMIDHHFTPWEMAVALIPSKYKTSPEDYKINPCDSKYFKPRSIE